MIELLLAAIYFIVPIDLLPEIILGPFGYVDDLAVLGYLLKKLYKKIALTRGKEKLAKIFKSCLGCLFTLLIIAVIIFVCFYFGLFSMAFAWIRLNIVNRFF